MDAHGLAANSYALPGDTQFTLPNGTTFELDLVEAAQKIGQLSKEFAESQNGEHLAPWATWVLEKTGIPLKPGQADALWEQVLILRARTKADFFTTLNSLSSTDSAPSA